ncbi:MAG TPA: flavodoxin family protein [Bacteroidales bacterium]|jgi:multimeric flavodoxin WrbA|nr:flavodoxin family protein [Bacteroidales bacterium]OQB64911.1 MAG: 2-amino-4-deoxychorismate dehydrogenase [Bacteroidetes bacterium ADurb.Bin145]NMD01953.1 flavodoxin family protein [Bacteroidales bacterium]HOU03223.1 flavodoxin family protein [Bacteroidales bacterium]HQG63908.1 flavodoxin family protein [Bacteroidales bacterium]
MKVLGINCSPRKGGNTELLIKETFKTLEENGIETEFFQLGGEKVNGCIACLKCRKEKDAQCHQDNEAINSCIKRMLEADGIIIGAPVYFADLASEAKALIDVAGYAIRGAGNALKRKAGAAVIAVRRAGAIHAFDSINHFFLINEMIIPGSSYWNIGIGREKGEVLNDEEGLNTMRVLGENMAFLLKRLNERQS